MIDPCRYLTVLTLLTVIGTQFALADEVSYFDKDGIRYRETVRKVRRPVATTRLEEREEIVYRRQLSTEMRDTLRSYQTPVTQYYWATRIHGRWNPFAPPYLTHDLVPVTRWQQHSEIVSVPVSRQKWVPEKRVTKVPVTTYRMAEDEVISRVAIGASAAGSLGGGATSIARRPSIGGVEMKNDPPRISTGWRAVGSSVRR